MSKAFTREDDGAEAPLPPVVSALPPGSPNLVTAAGQDRLRREAADLAAQRTQLLPAARGTAPDPDARAELRRVEQRLRHVEQSLRTAQVPGPPDDRDLVQFGAAVTVRDGAGEAATYWLVGEDEADAAANRVSWFSPLGRALIGARRGGKVELHSPRGRTVLEVLEVKYE